MKSSYKTLATFIEPVNQLNDGMEVKELLGISNQKFFQNSHTNTIDIDLQTYRIVRTNQFAYNRATTRNGDKISIALRQGNDCIVSPSYRIFRSKDENILNSEYLMMWFRRPEFDRYARFKSHGSAHEFFEYDQMCQVELPIPHITKQKEIVKEYNVIQTRITLNQELIRKLEEAAQAIYKQWFVEGSENNSEKIKLSELVQTQYGYTESASSEIIGPKFLRITDIAQNHIDWANVPYCKITDSDFKKYRLKPGDIVVARTGATAGYGKRLHKHFPNCVFASFLVRLIPNEIKWNLYLGLIVDSQNYRDFILSNAGGSAQPQANATLLTSYEIDKPDESKILEFNSVIEPIFDLIENYQLEIQKLTELKNLLLSKLATIVN
jgi:type I restriction enzyme S subunit